MKFFSKHALNPGAALCGLYAIQAVIGYEWLHGGLGKIEGGTFATGLGKTLGVFAANNPLPWMKQFLLGGATENALALGYAIEWGELAVGVALIASLVIFWLSRSVQLETWARAILVLALVGGMFMSATFYFAAGWMSPSTAGVNMIMFWVQAALLIVHISFLTQKSTT
ncbi:MAG: hypothetical protein AAB865_02030 [Patescibacteria group bacterium]